MDSISIYDFIDYRLFLRTWLEKKKEANRHYSLQVWANRLGINNKSTLSMILQGKRGPGSELCDKFATFFEFDKEERDYFFTMVKVDKLKKKNSSLGHLLNRELALKRHTPEDQLIEPSFVERNTKWYYIAIKELVGHKDFQSDPKWIQDQLWPEVDLEEIEQVIKDLLAFDLLKLTEKRLEGRTKKACTPRSNITSLGIQQFHKSQLELGRQAIDRFKPEQRHFTGLTLPVSKESIPDIKNFIHQFCDEFFKEFETKNGDTLLQLNLQCFPLNKVHSNKENEGSSASEEIELKKTFMS